MPSSFSPDQQREQARKLAAKRMHRQMALEMAQQRKRDEEAAAPQQLSQQPQQGGSQYMNSSFDAGAEGGGNLPPTDSLRGSMEFSTQQQQPLALVPHSGPRLPLVPQQNNLRPSPYSAPRALNPELQSYLSALTGPEDRPPLVYSGDIKSSLDQLRKDAVNRYQALSYALGERSDRLDLLLGSIGGRLGLPPPPPFPPQLSSLASAPLSLPPINISHYTPSRPFVPPSSMVSSSAGTIGYRGSSAWSGGMEPPGSASFFGEGLGGGGLRISNFEMDTSPIPEADLLSGMMVGREVTRMVYPQVGADFEGRISRSALAGQRIDSLSDLRYHKPSHVRYDDLLVQVASNGGMVSPLDQDAPRLPKSQQRQWSELDQTERFLRDFASRETRSRGPYRPPPSQSSDKADGGDPTLLPLKDQESSFSFTLPLI